MANGQMPSSLILGYSRCQRPTDWRANPDEETTDWRARRGRTAHRVRREGTVKAVPYPYPSRECGRSQSAAGLGWLPSISHDTANSPQKQTNSAASPYRTGASSYLFDSVSSTVAN